MDASPDSPNYDRRCLTFNFQVLYYCGFWPMKTTEKRNLAFYFRYLFPRVMIVRMMYGAVFQIINLTLKWGNLLLMAEYLLSCALQIMTLVHCVTLLYNRKWLKLVFDEFERLHDPKMTGDDQSKTLVVTFERFVYYFTKVIFIAVVVFVTLAMSVAVVEGLATRKIPFRFWYPYDYNYSPVFEVTLVVSMFFPIVDFLIIAIGGTTFCSLVLLTMGQFLLLRHKLKNIHTHVTNKMNKRYRPTRIVKQEHKSSKTDQPKRKVKLIRSKTEVSLRTRNEDFERYLGECVVALRSQSGFRRTAAARREPEMNKTREMEMYLRHCIKLHQKLLNITDIIKRVFKAMLAQQVLYNVMEGTGSLFLTSLSRSVDTMALSLVLLLFFGYMVFLVYCLLGDQILIHGEGVRHDVYDCDWFGASESFKRSMRIMITRTNRPLLLKAGGLPLCIGSFRLICRAAYYLHLFLSNVLNGKKIVQKPQ